MEAGEWEIQKIPTLTGHNSYVSSIIKLSEDIIVSGSGDKTLKFWKADNDAKYKEINTIKGLNSEVLCLLKISPNEIASGFIDSKIKIWREENGKFIESQTLLGHSKMVTSLIMISHEIMASASEDKSIRIWKKEKGCFNEIQNLTSHVDSVKCLLRISDTVFASGGEALRVWEIENGKFKEFLGGQFHENWLTCLIKWKDNTIVSGSLDNSLKVIKFETYTGRIEIPVKPNILKNFVKTKTIKDFQKMIIKGDGHCMYTSILQSRLSGQDDVESLRREVANAIRKKEWPENAIFAEHGCVNKEMYALKVERMTPVQYGNEIDLAAFVDIKGISVSDSISIPTSFFKALPIFYLTPKF